MSYFGKNGPLVVGIMWTETLVALLFVIARIYTRTRLIRNMGWDDFLILITMFLFFGYTISCTVAAVNGMGSHAADLGVTQTVKAIKWEITGQTFNIAAIATSKNSVAVFLLRIVTRKVHVWVLWFCIFSTTFVCVSCIIFMYTQCTPLESIFNPTIEHVCYLNFTIDAIFSGSYTALMDFTLAIFPWFILWQLNMKRKERLTIALGLSLGVLAGICGVIRAVELQGVSGKADYTFLTLPLILWGSTELFVCIMCASIPILRPLYKQIRGANSSSAPYELGNTPSRQLEAGGKIDTKNSYHSHSASHGAAGAQQNSSGRSGNCVTVYMGGTHDNSSDEEILKDMQGRMEEGLTGKGIKIHKTTRVDVSFQDEHI